MEVLITSLRLIFWSCCSPLAPFSAHQYWCNWRNGSFALIHPFPEIFQILFGVKNKRISVTFTCPRRRKSVLKGSEASAVESVHWWSMYAVRATERVPAGSCHFPCSTDPSQSVVSFPCVWKWERIKTKYATNTLATRNTKGGWCYEMPPGSDTPLWHGELSALPSLLAGRVTVCVWDHIGPSWPNEVWCRGKT